MEDRDYEVHCTEPETSKIQEIPLRIFDTKCEYTASRILLEYLQVSTPFSGRRNLLSDF